MLSSSGAHRAAAQTCRQRATVEQPIAGGRQTGAKQKQLGQQKSSWEQLDGFISQLCTTTSASTLLSQVYCTHPCAWIMLTYHPVCPQSTQHMCGWRSQTHGAPVRSCTCRNGNRSSQGLCNGLCVQCFWATEGPLIFMPCRQTSHACYMQAKHNMSTTMTFGDESCCML